MDGEPSSQSAEETDAYAMEAAAEGKGPATWVVSGTPRYGLLQSLVGPFPSALCGGRSRSRKRAPRSRLRAGDGAWAVVLHQELSSRASSSKRNCVGSGWPKCLFITQSGPHHLL